MNILSAEGRSSPEVNFGTQVFVAAVVVAQWYCHWASNPETQANTLATSVQIPPWQIVGIKSKRENAGKSQQVDAALTKGHLDSKRQLFSLLTDAARPAEIFQHFLFWFQIPASAVICFYLE